MAATRKIPVFIASPGDLAEERQTFKRTLKTLNDGFGVGADVEFHALGWEDTLATTGQRSQALINTDIDQCEVFILCLHRCAVTSIKPKPRGKRPWIYLNGWGRPL